MTPLDLYGLWAIRAEAGENLRHSLERFLEAASPEQMAAIFGRRDRADVIEPLPYDIQGNGIAVFQIEGALSKRVMSDWWTGRQMGTTYGQIIAGVKAAQADPAVRSIVMAWDSPGGTVDGAQEASNDLYAMRQGGKPMESVAVGQMCSAAEMVGSATGTVWASSDTTDMGSIGVLAIHRDFSGMEEKLGIKTTMLTAGKYKGIGFGPLTQSDKAVLQEGLDHSYQVFKQTVARNRGISMDAVEAMAEGRVFKGQKAVAVGLANGIATVSQRVAALSKQGATSQHRTALAVAEPTTNPQQEKRRMTKEELLAQHPELAEAFRTEGRAEGQALGAETERNRIKAVLEQKAPGHEALVEGMAWDGKSTAGDAAVAVLSAQRAKTAQVAKNITEDAPGALNVPNKASANDEEEEDKPKALSGVEMGRKIQAVIAEHKAKGIEINPTQALQIIRAEG